MDAFSTNLAQHINNHHLQLQQPAIATIILPLVTSSTFKLLIAPITSKMVSIKSLAAILAVGVLSATAAPAVEADAIHARQKGTLPSVQACKDKEFGGECKTFEEEAGSCCKSKHTLTISSPQVLRRGLDSQLSQGMGRRYQLHPEPAAQQL
jgi:hypothetical protein